MSTSPASQLGTPATRSVRFFALTPERLELVVRHRLTRAELLVWSHVELHAKPRCPVAFTLEGVAVQLELGVASVRRAVRRLLHVRLLVGLFEGNRYRLAPAGGAFDQAGENLPEREGSPARSPQRTAGPAVARSAENLPPEEGTVGENLPEREGDEPEDARHDEAGAQSPELHVSENKKLSFMTCGLTRELADQWGMYRPVAERLVATHGRDRVTQVLAWGRHLRDSGKLRSRGWAYQALVRGWDAPDSFHAARHKAQEGLSVERQVSPVPSLAPVAAEPLDEAGRVETLRTMYSSPVAPMKRMAVTLAGKWGVPLEAFGASL